MSSSVQQKWSLSSQNLGGSNFWFFLLGFLCSFEAVTSVHFDEATNHIFPTSSVISTHKTGHKSSNHHHQQLKVFYQTGVSWNAEWSLGIENLFSEASSMSNTSLASNKLLLFHVLSTIFRKVFVYSGSQILAKQYTTVETHISFVSLSLHFSKVFGLLFWGAVLKWASEIDDFCTGFIIIRNEFRGPDFQRRAWGQKNSYDLFLRISKQPFS